MVSTGSTTENNKFELTVAEPVEGPLLSKCRHSARLTNLYKKWFRQAQPPKRINLKWRSLSLSKGRHSACLTNLYKKWFRQAQPPKRINLKWRSLSLSKGRYCRRAVTIPPYAQR